MQEENDFLKGTVDILSNRFTAIQKLLLDQVTADTPLVSPTQEQVCGRAMAIESSQHLTAAHYAELLKRCLFGRSGSNLLRWREEVFNLLLQISALEQSSADKQQRSMAESTALVASLQQQLATLRNSLEQRAEECRVREEENHVRQRQSGPITLV